jgi:hypothetical protein
MIKTSKVISADGLVGEIWWRRCVSNQKLKARIAKMQKAANCLAAFLTKSGGGTELRMRNLGFKLYKQKSHHC